MHRRSSTLSRRNVKQEICNSYHLEGTFDPVVSPIGRNIRFKVLFGALASEDGVPGGRVFIVRVSGTTVGRVDGG